jgi:hypothetical protein
MNENIAQYAFYAMLVIVSGVGEYYHLVPSGSLTGALLLVSGHYFGNGTTKAQLTNISSSVATLAQQQQQNTASSHNASTPPPA